MGMRTAGAEHRRAQIEVIQHAVAGAFNLSIYDLKQSTRTRTVAIPRQIAMYLARQLTDASVAEIGLLFGKHYTTVVQAIAKIEEQRRSSIEVDFMVTKLLRIIGTN